MRVFNSVVHCSVCSSSLQAVRKWGFVSYWLQAFSSARCSTIKNNISCGVTSIQTVLHMHLSLHLITICVWYEAWSGVRCDWEPNRSQFRALLDARVLILAPETRNALLCNFRILHSKLKTFVARLLQNKKCSFEKIVKSVKRKHFEVFLR